MNQELVPIYSAKDAFNAELLRAELEKYGITAWVVNEKLGAALGELPPGWSTNPRLLVEASQAEQARNLAVEFDLRTSSHIGAKESADELDPTAAHDDTLDAWPRCPECDERRLAICRICQTSGNDFPLAYSGAAPPHFEATDDPQVMVVCPGCDEPFFPEYYKLCEHCGHEFATGRSVRQPVRSGGEADPQINSGRLLIVLACFVGFLIASAAYLWSLSF
jgi:hypothetical protein